MVYIMKIHVDGGCRANGQPGSIGAAAAAFKSVSGIFHRETKEVLPSHPAPTNQGAEITSIILGLRMALDKSDHLYSDPRLDVTIYSDSTFAVNCMEKWIYKWINNGWINRKGIELANRDLLEKAAVLDGRLKEKGDVHYVWISREENQYVDKLCNDLINTICLVERLCNSLKNARCDVQGSSSIDS
ncbi:ribonuclease H1 [Aspergillus vadensis CBS 113365]|uniref:Ribonuclease H1 n=1 Tax=Aspergillus vadensis (strain CBS 113365 / IMI 142717 / IBT 24658) TaxID=1448311 RepID=A0A319B4F3_ASPVC|nr:ribonuclease H1 [Aspergillus vadensis CBS 113365]PYH66711.1 ribonuclease H1 [Aspergillus vadensis CBS 113365]